MREDWIECTLGELISITSGNAFKKSEYSNSGVRLFQIANVSFNKTSWDKIAFLPESYLQNEKYQNLILEKGDIVMALNRPMLNGQLKISELSLNDVPAILYQRVGKFNLVKSLQSKYLLYYLQSPIFIKWLTEKLQGVNIPFINQSKLLSYSQFPFTSQSIQKAIVKKVEELFSSLDSGITDLKKAQDQLAIYRQAVLKKAFEGEFKKVKLEDACGKATKVKRKEMDINEPLLYLDIGGIDNKTNIIFSHKKYTWENAPSRAQQIVKVGDVLFSTVRTYLKNIAQVNNPIYNDEIASSGFTVIRGKKDLLNPKFIFFIATSQFFLEPLNKLQRGTSYPAVRDKDVFSQLIPLPTLEEQQLIVKEIESRLSVCDTVEKDITDSLEKAQALRQSILKKAFEGTLLSDEEIAKCKADAAYEPASVLLERIKAEKKKK